MVHGPQHIRVLAHPEIIIAAPNRHEAALSAWTVPHGCRKLARNSLELDERPVAAVHLRIGYELAEALAEIRFVGHFRPVSLHFDVSIQSDSLSVQFGF
jgi:hypothetical protein